MRRNSSCAKFGNNAMELIYPDTAQVGLGMRAMKALIESKEHDKAEGGVELDFLAGVQRFWGTSHDVARLAPITPEELAGGLVEPALRRQLMVALTALSLIDGQAQPAEIDLLRVYAAALEVPDRVTEMLRMHTEGHLLRMRLDLLRRSWVAAKIRDEIRPDQGMWGVLRILWALVTRREDRELTARYRALGDHPAGSLGRGYWEYMQRNAFPFPGEKGAPPEIITIHDCVHILSDYDTDPDGEVQVVGFTIGFAAQDPADHLISIMLQFHVGTHIAPQVPPSRGHFSPEKFLRAVRRGAAMNIDLNDRWDPWTVFDQPVSSLRERYGIPPADDGAGA
jgi:hypothetical protein